MHDVDFQRLIDEQKPEKISQGLNQAYKLEVNGEDVFYKRALTDDTIWKNRQLPLVKNKRLDQWLSIPQWVENRVRDRIMQLDPLRAHRLMIRDPHALLQKELKTVKLWMEHNILCPELLYEGDADVAYEWIEGRNFKEVLSDSGRKLELGNLLDTYMRIRYLALENQNRDFFHSDVHIENWMYGDKTRRAYPIDPASHLHKSMNRLDIDARLNLELLFSFFRADASLDVTHEYVKIAVDRFSQETRERMRELSNTPLVVKGYYLGLNKARELFERGPLFPHATNKDQRRIVYSIIDNALRG